MASVKKTKALSDIAGNEKPTIRKKLKVVDPKIDSLTRTDIQNLAKKAHPSEIRYLVANYYQRQADRIRFGQQMASVMKIQENSQASEVVSPKLLSHYYHQAESGEAVMKQFLDAYTDQHPVGKWLKNIFGIGPVTSAGLLAHIDIEKAPTAGHIWSFMGYTPTSIWKKGEKRPWNADLKLIGFHIGNNFKRFSTNPKCYYGKLYREYKERYVAKNEAGEYAARAAQQVADKRYGTTTASWGYITQGKLPPAHIDAMARRKVVCLFIAHLQQEWYRCHFGKEPPVPYVIQYLGHAHKIEPQDRMEWDDAGWNFYLASRKLSEEQNRSLEEDVGNAEPK